MRIAVLGTGAVGRGLATALDRLGHNVTMGTRDPAHTRVCWTDHDVSDPGVTLLAFAEAATGAEVVVNATSGAVSLDVLDQAGAADFHGTVLVDVSNALDFSAGFPPRMLVDDTESMAERIQRRFPGTRVVKTLNTMNHAVMVDPGALGESTTVFVSGDDPDAKAVVTGLLHSLGHDDVIDLGDVSTARGPELWMPLWLRLAGALGTAEMNLKVVRRP